MEVTRYTSGNSDGKKDFWVGSREKKDKEQSLHLRKSLHLREPQHKHKKNLSSAQDDTEMLASVLLPGVEETSFQ